MPGDLLDDDYVARLLAEDARKTSRNASYGLTAPRRDGMKPNTRFLSHIVREADGHNAALKKKEEQEARRRLRALKSDESHRKKRRTDESNSSKRRRLLNDIVGAAADQRPNKSDREKSRSSRDSDQQRRASRFERHNRSDERARDSRRSASPQSEKRKNRHRSSSRERHHDRLEAAKARPEHESTIRGRGADKPKRSTDHLAEGYDPSLDVSERSDLDEDDDWDMALEAMRDRARYKKSQASRMRDAGFSDQYIAKFEQSLTADSKDGDMSRIKWSQKGQIREWDVNKVVLD